MAAGNGGRHGDGMDIVQSTVGRRRLPRVNAGVCALSGLLAVAAGGWLADVAWVAATVVLIATGAFSARGRRWLWRRAWSSPGSPTSSCGADARAPEPPGG